VEERTGGLLATLLLVLVVATLLVAAVQLAMRGAPWSDSGYRKARTVHATAPPLPVPAPPRARRSADA